MEHINFVFNLVKKRKHIIPRLNFEVHRFKARIRYRFEKTVGYDPLQREVTELKKSIVKSMTSNDSYIKDKIINQMENIFLHDDIENAASYFKDDFICELKTAADKTLSNKFYILHEYRNNIYDEETGHYKWYHDYATGFRYKITHYSEVRQKNIHEGVDIKHLWELSRMQYLFAPALYWRISGDSKYAEFVIKVLSDWIDENRYEEGPNWNIAMEVGIRVTNMILVFQLIKNYEGLENSFCEKFVASAFLHLKFILNNEEKYMGKAYNHYLGNLIGVLAVSAAFPFLPNNSRHLKYAIDSFEKEMKIQVLDDGGSFEGSTCYHGLVGEIFTLAALICRRRNIKMSDDYFNRLNKMVIFSRIIEKHNGYMPQIGDNDGGRIIQLLPHNALDYRFYQNIAHWLTSGKLLNLHYRNHVFCFTGNINYIQEEKIVKDKNISIFQDSKLVVYKSENLYLLIGAVEAQKHGFGGHTHNDKLAVEIAYKGKDFIIDPGTGSYTANAKVHQQLRSVNAHSTVCIHGREQNIKQPQGVFGNSYEATSKIDGKRMVNNIFSIEGSVLVKHPDFSYKHKRIIEINDKEKIRIIDKVGCCSDVNVKCNFILAPGVEVSILDSNAILRFDNLIATVIAPTEMWVDKGIYSPRYNKWTDTKIVSFCEKISKTPLTFITEIEFNDVDSII